MLDPGRVPELARQALERERERLALAPERLALEQEQLVPAPPVRLPVVSPGWVLGYWPASVWPPPLVLALLFIKP